MDRCKGKGNQLVEKHIKTIQNAYQETHQSTPQLMINENKKKTKYKIKEYFCINYINISLKSSRPKSLNLNLYKMK